MSRPAAQERLGRLLAVHDLGGNIPGQLAAAGLLPRLESLSQRRAETVDQTAQVEAGRGELRHVRLLEQRQLSLRRAARS